MDTSGLLQRDKVCWEVTIQSVILNTFYTRLWSLNIPSKIRIGLWKIANEFMPTLCILKIRKHARDAFCPVCKVEEESLAHLFWECAFTTQVLLEIGVVFLTTDREQNWKQWLAVGFVNSSILMCRKLALSYWDL